MKRTRVYLEDLITITERQDIRKIEKWRLFGAYLKLKFERDRNLKALGYRIASVSRDNAIGILKEVFFLGDYAFKSDSARPFIVDVGANIGAATLFFKRYHPSARILAFEAAPENFKCLEQNIHDNKLQDVTPVFGALGVERGERTFYFNPKRPGSSTGMQIVVDAKKATTFVPITVPAIRLSDHLTEEVDLLKMDVEGAEGLILKDLEEARKLSLVKQMVFEYHANPENKDNELVAVLTLLERNGFSTVIYDNEGGAYGKSLVPVPYYHFMIRAYRK